MYFIITSTAHYSCFHEVNSCTALTTSRVYVLTRCSRLCLNFNLSFNPDNNMALGFYLLQTKDHPFFVFFACLESYYLPLLF